MDFPKSVPNVGLVDGRFVDESNVTGQVGSLITADWGNAMTSEIINVIEAAELVPTEGQNDQLVGAIERLVSNGSLDMVTVKKIVSDELPGMATEEKAGIARLATQVQVDAGVDNTTVITPKKLRMGFSMSLAQNGYVSFPTWLGGLVLQWGRNVSVSSANATIAFPYAFPNSCYAVSGNADFGADSFSYYRPVMVGNLGLASFQVRIALNGDSNAAGQIETASFYWIAIGG